MSPSRPTDFWQRGRHRTRIRLGSAESAAANATQRPVTPAVPRCRPPGTPRRALPENADSDSESESRAESRGLLVTQ